MLNASQEPNINTSQFEAQEPFFSARLCPSTKAHHLVCGTSMAEGTQPLGPIKGFGATDTLSGTRTAEGPTNSKSVMYTPTSLWPRVDGEIDAGSSSGHITAFLKTILKVRKRKIGRLDCWQNKIDAAGHPTGVSKLDCPVAPVCGSQGSLR